MLFRLTVANLLVRRVRTALTVTAIAFSVALVVAMTSGFAAFQNAADTFLGRFAGVVDARIGLKTDPTHGVDRAVVRALEADPRVQRAWGRLDSDAPLPKADTTDFMTPRASIVGVERGKDPVLDWLRFDAGRWFDVGEAAMVVDSQLAERWKIKVGDAFAIAGQYGELKLPVVGVVHMTGAFGPMASHKIYLPLATAQKFVFGEKTRDIFTSLSVQFRTDVDADAFVADWTKRLQAIDPLLSLKLARTTREEVDKNLGGLRLLSTLGGEVALLTAMFVIFSTLSMGVAERQRLLATLRAIGMSRRQLAATVVGEATLLASVGVAIGTPVGYAGAAMLVKFLAQRFQLSPALDLQGLLIAAGSAIGASIVASALPAWRAARVDPLEAMTPLADPSRDRFPFRTGILGLVLIAIDPLLFIVPYGGPMARELRFYLHFTIGLPTLVLGFFMAAPMLVAVISQTLGRVFALLMRVPYALVKQQSGDSHWRAAGTCSALMVGLATLVVMQTQGRSSLDSWRLPTKFPDVFVFTQSISGLTPKSQELIRNSPLLKREDTMPIGAINPEVGTKVFGVKVALAGLALPSATKYIAVEPDKAFRLMQLDFRRGNAEDAAREMTNGRAVVVTEDFQKARNVDVGDSIQLKGRGDVMLSYKVVGVVWSPGIDVMISTFDVGQAFEQQSASCVFGSLANARRDFGLENVFMMCANLAQLGIERDEVLERLKGDLGEQGLRIADVRKLKHDIQKGLEHLLTGASLVAWGALAVASLGVANAIAAGVRSRMWQFGVLRSVGLPRAALLRGVLVEALLLGCVGAIMGLLCGAVMTFDSRHLLSLVIGHEPPISVPWRIVFLGVGVVILVSLLSSATSAIGVARKEPLALLQGGRSSG